MSFAIPSLADLVTRVRSAFRAYLPGTDAWIWPNNVYVTGKVVGGALQEVFGRLDYVRKQAFVLTAEGQWLAMHGSQYNLAPKPPVQATGQVAVTVIDATTFAAGGQFLRGDGAVFAVVADVSIAAAGTAFVPVLAVSGGKAGITQPVTPLTIQSGASGPGAASALAVVGEDGIVGGADTEPDGAPYTSDLSTFRGRILFRLRNPPHGGAPPDYVIWCSAVPGVTRVFVERRYAGPGTVRVFPLFDDLFPAQGGVPGPANIVAVQTELEPLVPSGAGVVVAQAAPLPIDVRIFALTPNTSATQEAVLAELQDMVRRLGQVAGSDYVVASMPYLATPQTFSAAWVSDAVGDAEGVKRFTMRAPLSDIAIPAGSIPVLGKVTFESV